MSYSSDDSDSEQALRDHMPTVEDLVIELNRKSSHDEYRHDFDSTLIHENGTLAYDEEIAHYGDPSYPCPKLPPPEHTFSSDSADERLFWGLDQPLPSSDLDSDLDVASDADAPEGWEVLSNATTWERLVDRARLRLPWRFNPTDKVYTPALVRTLEREVKEEAVRKRSPYAAHIIWAREQRVRRRVLLTLAHAHRLSQRQHRRAGGRGWRMELKSLGEEEEEEEAKEAARGVGEQGGEEEEDEEDEEGLGWGVRGVVPWKASVVHFQTAPGPFSIELYRRFNPRSCAVLASLASSSFFLHTPPRLTPAHHLLFHGNGSALGAVWGALARFKLESDPVLRQDGGLALSHCGAGVVSMKRSQPRRRRRRRMGAGQEDEDEEMKEREEGEGEEEEGDEEEEGGEEEEEQWSVLVTMRADPPLDASRNVVGRISSGMKVLRKLATRLLEHAEAEPEAGAAKRAGEVTVLETRCARAAEGGGVF